MKVSGSGENIRESEMTRSVREKRWISYIADLEHAVRAANRLAGIVQNQTGERGLLR